MAEDHHVGGVLDLVALPDVAAERGRTAEQGEESGRDPHPAELLRRLGVTELQIGAAIGGDPLERPQLGAIVAEIRGREREMGIGRRFLEQAHEAIRIRIRQGRDQDALDRAPDRGVGADGDGQGQGGGGGEPRGPPQEPDRVAEIMGPHGPLDATRDDTVGTPLQARWELSRGQPSDASASASTS